MERSFGNVGLVDLARSGGYRKLPISASNRVGSLTETNTAREPFCSPTERRIALSAISGTRNVGVVGSPVRFKAICTPLDVPAVIGRTDYRRLVRDRVTYDGSCPEGRQRIPPTIGMAAVARAVISVPAMSFEPGLTTAIMTIFTAVVISIPEPIAI